VSRVARVVSGQETAAWRSWLKSVGALAREMRELLGLSQDQLAKLAHVSQGAVSRFEKGNALSTPWVVAVKLRVALAARLRQLDPELLTADARRFLSETALYGLPDDPALPPHFANIALLPAPELTQVLLAYNQLPQECRAAFMSVMSAVVEALAQER
jgi:transcriptional regulator with XRE-family HTH domain